MTVHNNIATCRESVELQFEDITLQRKQKDRKLTKNILNKISGCFHSGKLTAIIGPSGAGKTSLLNVLSGFRTVGVKGNIYINGNKRVLQTFRKRCCYITQEFAILPLLTVKEILKSTTDLKLGNTVDNDEKNKVIDEIGSILGLTTCMNTQVRHLSGGEKKRLSIGMELITNPPIMFFDEPTSGLDSSSSVQIVTHLKTLASGGRTIVCVVHQPSSRIFEMFDEVYILAEGRCLYSGPVDNMVPHLEGAGFKCPQYYNRADFAIEVASRERGDNLINLLNALDRNIQIESRPLRNVSEEEHNEERLAEPRNEDPLEPMLENKSHIINMENLSNNQRYLPVEKVNSYPTSTWYQFVVLLKRSVLCSTIRDPFMAQLRFAAQILVGIFMGTVFYDVGNEASKVHTNASYIFFSLMFIFFSNGMPTVQTFPQEAAVFMREHLNNWYSMKAYYFSKLVADLPLQVLCPSTYVLITYFMSSQPLELYRVGMFLLICYLLTTMSQALGHAFGAAFDVEMGIFLLPASGIPMLLFSGYFLVDTDVPVFLRWLSHISYIRFPFQGMMLAVYGFDRPNLQCSRPYCHNKYPNKLLSDLNIDLDSYWIDVAGLVVWIFVFRLLFYGVLKWKLYRVRGFC